MSAPKNRQPQLQSPSIPDEEWDFRGVTEDLLIPVIQYEYARSTVAAGGNKAALTLPPDVVDAINRQAAKPWTLLSHSERESICKCGLLRAPAISIEPSKPEDSQRSSLMAPSPFGYGSYSMSIDWLELYDSELIKFFTTWVKDHRPKGARPAKGAGGKACSPPWDWLRELAAWRLQSAGYNHGAALKLAKDLPRRKPVTPMNDVLPNYAGSGARFKAVELAEKRIKGGLRLVHICQRWPKGERFLEPFYAERLAPMVIEETKPG